jgi:transcriptional regulator GlxA family with amidase domain
LAGLSAGVTVERDVVFVDDVVLSSAGVAAGIEAAFHLVEELCGRAVADETARYIEYNRARAGLRVSR